ncbi:DUF1289 domain-containing protein [Fulvimarina sp. 2208YS6-2-32]|uniref:DUF1289 domain-containing protein n=2 Tax=Fulvimarina uroteuthidis TaxID=3098149 RepID=A0ABU5I973_9HYPH|nr:DUF1289 domain-containing protein [Fulvimarina sp. 2208YS6-2-32]
MSQVIRDEPGGEEAAWESAPSPCIDVCKYKRQGRCIACSMTKLEKQAFPHSGGAAQKRAFINALIGRLEETGRNPAFWAYTYRHKCEREGVPCPIEIEEG